MLTVQRALQVSLLHSVIGMSSGRVKIKDVPLCLCTVHCDAIMYC